MLGDSQTLAECWQALFQGRALSSMTADFESQQACAATISCLWCRLLVVKGSQMGHFRHQQPQCSMFGQERAKGIFTRPHNVVTTGICSAAMHSDNNIWTVNATTTPSLLVLTIRLYPLLMCPGQLLSTMKWHIPCACLSWAASTTRSCYSAATLLQCAALCCLCNLGHATPIGSAFLCTALHRLMQAVVRQLHRSAMWWHNSEAAKVHVHASCIAVLAIHISG